MIVVLLKKLCELKAIDKFLVLKVFVQNPNSTDIQDLEVTGNFKQIGRRYGFSEGVVARTFTYLMSMGVLEKRENKKSSRGRPDVYYKRQPISELIECFGIKYEKRNDFTNEHRSSLLEVNSHMLNETGKRLENETRMLLFVLLYYSDDFGFVQNLQNSDLRKITGLKAAALKGRLEKLSDYGYLRSKVSGINETGLYGRVSSIYILNLQHEKYHCAMGVTRKYLYFKRYMFTRPDKTPIKNPQDLIAAPGTFEAEKLITIAKGVINLLEQNLSESTELWEWDNKKKYPELYWIIELSGFKRIASLFADTSNQSCFGYFLQFKLNQYASMLLPKILFKKGKCATEMDDEIKQLIRKEVFYKQFDNNIRDKFQRQYTDKDKSYIVELLFSISQLISRKINLVLNSKNTPDKDESVDFKCRILPSLKNDLRYTAVDTNFNVQGKPKYSLYGETLTTQLIKGSERVGEELDISINDQPKSERFFYKFEEKNYIVDTGKINVKIRFLMHCSELSKESLHCFSLRFDKGFSYSGTIADIWQSKPHKKFKYLD